MNIDIAYIVSHGFAARMVMQTNLLGKLVQKGKKVALIAPDRSDANLVAYCQKEKIKLYEFNPKLGSISSNYIKSRAYFLENINDNPALYEKYVYATKYTKHATLVSKIKPRIYKVIHDLKEVIPSIKKWYLRREDKMLNSAEAIELLQEINAQKLVSTYPVNFLEGMLLKAANQLEIETVIHLLSWDNISCKGHFPHLADKYITWGKVMSDELQEYYQIKPENISVTGVPHFDLHSWSRDNREVDQYLKLLELDSSKPYLFFGMSSPRFAPKEIDIVEWLSRKVESNEFGKNIQLIVRPHPQNMQGDMKDATWIPRLESLQSRRVAIDYPNLSKSRMAWSMQEEDMIRLSQLIAHAEVSFNSGSTLTIDSFMAGTPVILTSFDGNEKLNYWESAVRLLDYTHLNKLVSFGDVDVAYNYSDFSKMIMNSIGSTMTKDEVGLNTITNMTLMADGNSTDRVVDAILNS